MAACSDNNETSTGNTGGTTTAFAGTIKVGGLYPLSGQEASPLTFGGRTGMQTGINDVNASGGVEVAGKKYKLEHLVRDTESEAVATVAAAQDLISQGVTMVTIWECAHGDTAYQQLKAAKIISISTCPQVTY